MGVPERDESPLLYNVFTSDIPTPNSILFATFADDTVILTSHKHSILTVSFLQPYLNKTSHWTTKSIIKISKDKSVGIRLHSNKHPRLDINNKPVPVQNMTKYLGNVSLTWPTKPILNLKINMKKKILYVNQ